MRFTDRISWDLHVLMMGLPFGCAFLVLGTMDGGIVEGLFLGGSILFFNICLAWIAGAGDHRRDDDVYLYLPKLPKKGSLRAEFDAKEAEERRLNIEALKQRIEKGDK